MMTVHRARSAVALAALIASIAPAHANSSRINGIGSGGLRATAPSAIARPAPFAPRIAPIVRAPRPLALARPGGRIYRPLEFSGMPRKFEPARIPTTRNLDRSPMARHARIPRHMVPPKIDRPHDGHYAWKHDRPKHWRKHHYHRYLRYRHLPLYTYPSYYAYSDVASDTECRYYYKRWIETGERYWWRRYEACIED